MSTLQHNGRRAPLGVVVVIALGCVGFAATTAPALADTDEQVRAARELRAKYAAELESLARRCRERGLPAQAQKTLDVLGPNDPYKLYLPVLPQEAGVPKLPGDAAAGVVEWHERLWRLRREHATALYSMARHAVRRRPSLAYMLVLESIRANPDHEAVRRLLGYQKYRGRWHSLFEVQKLRTGHVRHEKFGWTPKSHLLRYEQGKRFHNGRWISAEEDARLHRDIHQGWVVETEHYAIRTNHSISSGVQLGSKLERLHRIWRQIFIRFYASEADVVALFDGRARSRRRGVPKFQVVFFRDREDYNRTLRAGMPNVEISIGVYLQPTQQAYFFAGKDYDERTLYHEATHQLFHQSRPVAPNVGRAANFWIVEGIAMYMESLHREGDYWVLGGPHDERFHAAQFRLLKSDFYVPLEEFATFGMDKLQTDPRIATLYSQAAGLTHFLVYYDSGRYRDALVLYLSAVYNGRDTPRTLSELTGRPYAELDRQYREFIQAVVKAGSQ